VKAPSRQVDVKRANRGSNLPEGVSIMSLIGPDSLHFLDGRFLATFRMADQVGVVLKTLSS
jgi:hypothetical protein